MTANLMYWLFAYVLTLVAFLIGLNGVSHIRRGDWQAHRKRMVASCNLILFFVASYVVKVLVLGREDKSDWSTFYLVVLYIHESFIACMLIFGVLARIRAAKLQLKTPDGSDAIVRKKHGNAGKMCLLFCALGILTATVVVFGMFERAGLV